VSVLAPRVPARGQSADGPPDWFAIPYSSSNPGEPHPPKPDGPSDWFAIPYFSNPGEPHSPKPEAPATEMSPGEAPSPWDEDLPLRVRLKDGLLLETPDEKYQFRIHLMNQTDFMFFSPGNQEPARSGVYNPRFRVYFEGQLTSFLEYELSLQRSIEGTFDVLDADINFHFSDGVQIRVGRALVPYSYDWYDHLEQYFITPERGLFPLNFGLSREAGIMLHGRIFDGRLQYAVGGFDGQLVGLADNNTTRDAVGYVNVRPFLRTERFPALRFLNIGGSIVFGEQAFDEAPLPMRTSVQSSENDQAAQGASAIFLNFNDNVVARGPRAQGALHMAWYWQHLSFEAEWQDGRFSYQRPATPTVPVPVSGYHITLGYFVTGEVVEGRTTVVPRRPFDPTTHRWGPGAIELFARYSSLDISQTIFDVGFADPTLWSRTAGVTDIGFNWYLNRYVKFYFDWQHSHFGTPVLLNPSEGKFGKNDDLYWIRCQFYY
jgi:phosphate-selective porin OprO/OprP